jgi:hypothetical protein
MEKYQKETDSYTENIETFECPKAPKLKPLEPIDANQLNLNFIEDIDL